MSTLQKCIEELKKDQPDIRYILGMLETYLELSVGATTIASTNPSSAPIFMTKRVGETVELTDEKTDLERRYEKGPIGNIT